MKGCSISTDFVYRGMRSLLMENEFLRVVCLLDSGARIIEFKYKPTDRDFLWHRPYLGHRPPKRLAGPTANVFDFWGGGWDEIFPTAWPCSYKKADYGVLGEIPFLQWRCKIEKNSSSEVAACLWTNTVRAPFTFKKRLIMHAGEKRLHIEEQLINRSEEPFDFLWAQHLVLRINGNCRISIPAERFTVDPEQCRRLEPGLSHRWPVTRDRDGKEVDLRIVPPRGMSDYWELLYFKDLRDGWLALVDESSHEAFTLVFPKDVFRFVWMSMLYGRSSDAPWYGSPYLLGLYPSTGYPATLTKALEGGEYASLGSRESLEARMIASVAIDVRQVRGVTKEGEVLQ